MKNSFFVWFFVVGVIVVVLVAFNYQSQKQKIPLSEIFPEEGVEFEFVDQVKESVASATKKVSAEALKAPQSDEVLASSQLAKTAPSATPATPKPEDPSLSTQVPIDSKITGKYAIQIASFKDREKAKQIWQDLKSKKWNPFIVQRDLKDQGVWYRVYAGQYESKDAAQNDLNDLKKDYAQSFIITTK